MSRRRIKDFAVGLRRIVGLREASPGQVTVSSFCWGAGGPPVIIDSDKIRNTSVGETIKIEKVTPSGGGFLVTVSSREQPLEMSALLFHGHRLKAGIVITVAQLEQLCRESEVERCDAEATRLLAMREHSVGEIKAKLKKKGFGESIIGDTVNRSLQRGHLDDRRFAFALARRTLERKPSGRGFLVSVLRRKMISRDLAEQVVGLLLENRDETGQAVAALERKWPTLAQLEVETARRKAYSYLSRRGFGYEAARAAWKLLSERHSEVDYDQDR